MLRLPITRAQLRKNFAAFFRAGWHVLERSTPLQWGWHLDVACEHLEVVAEDWARRQDDPAYVQRIRDILFTLPPGCLKSRLLVYWVPWMWLRWPTLRAICVSANPRISLRDSMYSRDVIASDWYQRTFQPPWQVRQDSDAKGLYSNTLGGFRMACGMDARIVGERADLIVVDDPHDLDEVESDALRAAVHDRWDTSIGNRVNDLASSCRIGIAQRSHEDDWSSRRIAEGWVHLDLPMQHEPERACVTPLGKPDRREAEGESLQPSRFTDEVIAAERKRVGERRWATLYQGRPAPAGGDLVKLSWLRFWRRPGSPDASSTRPSGCWRGPAVELPPESEYDSIAIGADLAAGRKTKHGDFNVIAVVARRGSSLFVLEVWRERADFPVVQRAFVEISERYPLARKVVERAAAGGALETSLRSVIPGLLSIPARGSKEQRLQAVLSFFEAGNVHFDENWPGLEQAITEITTFPNARFDDIPDALALAISHAVLGAEYGPVDSPGAKLFTHATPHGDPAGGPRVFGGAPVEERYYDGVASTLYQSPFWRP